MDLVELLLPGREEDGRETEDERPGRETDVDRELEDERFGLETDDGLELEDERLGRETEDEPERAGREKLPDLPEEDEDEVCEDLDGRDVREGEEVFDCTRGLGRMKKP